MSRFALRLALGLALACGAVATPANAQAEPRLLWSDVRARHEPALDVVFLPDGFTEKERAAFEDSVHQAVRQLETQKGSFVRADRKRWNFYSGFVASAAACPSAPGEAANDTAFHTHLLRDEEGGLFESDDAAVACAARALAPGTDAVVVIVRATQRIGFATGDLPREGARVRLPEGLEGVIVHELGHSLYALGDEYAGRARPLPDCEHTVVALYPNVSLDPSGARFGALGVKRPAVEVGALDFQSGVVRMAAPCIMRDPEADRFCPACAAVIAAGRPEGPPSHAPRPTLVTARAPGAAPEIAFEPAPAADGPAEGIVRRFAVLFRAAAPIADEDLRARFAAAEARVSRKTRYMESPWLGDGSAPGETVFSLEGQVLTCSLGALEPGDYAFVAASANLLASSPTTIVRFTVPQPGEEHR